MDAMPGQMDPLDRRNLSADAYDAVRKLIVSADLRPGQHLAVRPLTEKLGISPTPIRMALAQLARDGLLELHERRGYFVPEIQPEEMRDLYEIRASVDSIASRRVASLPVEERSRLVAELRHLIELQQLAVEANDLSRYSELDVTFHGLIWESARNRRLAVISGNLLGQVRAGNRISARAPGRLPVALAEHVAIVDALEMGDAGLAEQATRTHVEAASVALQSLLITGTVSPDQ